MAPPVTVSQDHRELPVNETKRTVMSRIGDKAWRQAAFVICLVIASRWNDRAVSEERSGDAETTHPFGLIF
jgi:hypothetical protein